MLTQAKKAYDLAHMQFPEFESLVVQKTVTWKDQLSQGKFLSDIAIIFANALEANHPKARTPEHYNEFITQVLMTLKDILDAAPNNKQDAAYQSKFATFVAVTILHLVEDIELQLHPNTPTDWIRRGQLPHPNTEEDNDRVAEFLKLENKQYQQFSGLIVLATIGDNQAMRMTFLQRSMSDLHELRLGLQLSNRLATHIVHT
jgi:hypothetical protein